VSIRRRERPATKALSAEEKERLARVLEGEG
jgi:cytochrome c-type biogenesis protein CcmH/NrfF